MRLLLSFNFQQLTFDDLHSFYPIFPVSLEVAHEVNLDVSHSSELRVAESPDDPGPDVIVLPSRLKHFSKVNLFP